MAKFRILALFAVLVSSAQLCAGSILSVDGGVYSRVTARIDADAVPRQHCKRAIKNLQHLISATSEQLFDVTGGLGRFGDVTVVLPSSWAATECADGLETTVSGMPERLDGADFVAAADSAVFGSSRPWAAAQYGGCGESNEHGGVNVPAALLAGSMNVSRESESRTFVAWARNRYGVFPESGFAGDGRYPESFVYAGEERATRGCNQTGGHEFLCTDPAKYDRAVPSKQNVLCNGRSALEVIAAHADFAVKDKVEGTDNKNMSDFAEKIRNPDSFETPSRPLQDPSKVVVEDLRQYSPPSFRFVFPGVRRFVLALDLSRSMDGNGGQWRSVRDGLFRLFSHIPLGAEVAIVTFGAKARVNIEPTVVTEQNREGIFGKIPFRLRDDENGCVACGLKLAARLLRLPDSRNGIDETSGAIILVSSTSTLTSTKKDSAMMAAVGRTVEEKAVPVYNVALRNTCDDVIKLTKFGGNYFLKPEDMSDMADVFLDIFNRNGDSVAKKIYRKEYVSGDKTISGNTISGNFVVESGLNRNLWMVLTSPFKEDVELFEVTSPSGAKFVFPKYQNGLVYFRLPGDNESGIWGYRAKLYPVVSNGARMTVEVIAESSSEATAANDDGAVILDGWTNVATGGADATVDAVAVYASLKQGNLPIRDAKVKATITRPGSSSPAEVVLRDDGTGYPDVTAGDGIYSAYFVDFTTEPGLYSVSLFADHNSGRASVPRPERPLDSDCCGSALSVNSFSIPTRSFERHAASPSFKVNRGAQFFVRNGEPARTDVFPPSRVTDVAVASYVNQTLYAVLEWSAPGGDRDAGAADRYELRCYTNTDALDEESFAKMGIPVHESLLPEPEEFGTLQSATVGLPWANEVFYCGLVASDEAGNRSPVSNLVPVYAAEFTTTTDLSVYGENGNDLEDVYSLDRALSSYILDDFNKNPTVYIVAGVVTGAIFILVVIVCVTILRSRRRAAARKKSAKARSGQIYANDIEHPHNPALSEDLKPGSQNPGNQNPGNAPPPPYGGVWSTMSASNHSPASHAGDFGNLYTPDWAAFQQNGQNGQHYHAHAAPVHEYRSGHVEAEELDSAKSVTPTYQNWSNPQPTVLTGTNSDNGTATTSSTECSNFESEENGNPTISGNTISGNNFRERRHSTDDALDGNGIYSTRPNNKAADYVSNFHFDPSMSLSPGSYSLAENRRRRQESLV